MGSIVLRMAYLLSVAPSVMAKSSACDVLALAYADTVHRKAEAERRELLAIRDARLVNLAMWAPDELRKVEESARVAVGTPRQTAGITPEMEQALAALPLETAE